MRQLLTSFLDVHQLSTREGRPTSLVAEIACESVVWNWNGVRNRSSVRNTPYSVPESLSDSCSAAFGAPDGSRCA